MTHSFPRSCTSHGHMVMLIDVYYEVCITEPGRGWGRGGCNSPVSSVLGLLFCLMQHCGFDPPWSLPIEGIFPLELTWVLTPFPTNSFWWEYKLRSSLGTHASHRMNSKDPDIHVLDGWMPGTKAHPVRTIHEEGMWPRLWLDEKSCHIRRNSHLKCWTLEI